MINQFLQILLIELQFQQHQLKKTQQKILSKTRIESKTPSIFRGKKSLNKNC